MADTIKRPIAPPAPAQPAPEVVQLFDIERAFAIMLACDGCRPMAEACLRAAETGDPNEVHALIPCAACVAAYGNTHTH